MKMTGKVTSLHGESAVIDCGNADGTGGKRILSVRNDAGALPGDAVEVDIPDSGLSSLSYAVLFLPAAAALVFYALASFILSLSAPFAYFISLAAFISCFVIIYFVFTSEKIKNRKAHITFRIIEGDTKDEKMGDKSGTEQ